MIRQQNPSSGSAPVPGASRANVFLVASDGRTENDAALIVGDLFAGATGVLRAIAVVDQINLVPESQVLFSAEVETARRLELKRDVETQMQRTLGRIDAIDLCDGDPARVIAQVARSADAAMIIAGLGRHRVTERLFGNETVLRLMRIAETPVFAAASTLKHRPRRIIAAIDFSETSVRATQLALQIAEPGATLFLTHVAPRDNQLYSWDATYKRNTREELAKLEQRLAAPAGIVVQHVLLQGDPATELLAYATSVDADLIATGSHGHGFVARLLIGSVATRLVRLSACSVLAVPKAAVGSALKGVPGSTTRTTPSAEWGSLLDDISKQNIGRLATLEVNDALVGAQIQETNYPFLGATYDRHDQRVELMFGAVSDNRQHLTRNINGVTSIDVLQDSDGHDVAIRVGHGLGQTLVKFEHEAHE